MELDDSDGEKEQFNGCTKRIKVCGAACEDILDESTQQSPPGKKPQLKDTPPTEASLRNKQPPPKEQIQAKPLKALAMKTELRDLSAMLKASQQDVPPQVEASEPRSFIESFSLGGKYKEYDNTEELKEPYKIKTNMIY